jgi:hypothetical protein
MRIGTIRLDVFDGLDGEPHKFRVHGFDDMEDTDDIRKIISFISREIYKILWLNLDDEDRKYGEVDVNHPLVNYLTVYLDGRKVKNCIWASDTLGEVVTVEIVDGQPVYSRHEGNVVFRLDDYT